MWKPGERQAMPTSWRPRWALPWPEGRAVRAPDEWTMLWLARLRRWGRCLVVVGMSGDVGSFLTTTLGTGPRDLREGRLDMSDMISLWGGDMEVQVGEEAEGGRHDEEEDREERLNDVRKR